jgi:tripartite-type tricarboxylate transporter receptor subunit TctC
LAQDYPNKTIRLIAPFAPAGANDILGRIISERLGDAAVEKSFKLPFDKLG